MRMRQKLAEKQAMDEAESSEKAAKVEFREQYKAMIEAWQAGKKVMSPDIGYMMLIHRKDGTEKYWGYGLGLTFCVFQ